MDTLFFAMLDFSKSIRHKLQGSTAREILDRVDGLENGLQTDVFPFFGSHVHLQKSLIRIALHADQIRDFNNFLDFTKAFSNSIVRRWSCRHGNSAS